MSNNSVQEEIEFRIQFKQEYGIDYNEALQRLKEQKKESERKWQNTLIKNRANLT